MRTGRAQDPWGTLEARLRRLRTQRCPVSAPRATPRRSRWSAFLANHREAIVACDFFTVPTLTFQLLSCFFVIEHRRRRILHFNVTREPTAAWVVQQLRDVFPGDGPHRFILFDHDSTFDGDVIAFLKATGLNPTRTAIQAPWQNGYASYCTSLV